MLLKDYLSCSTIGLKKLDTQLINQVNIIQPKTLIYFGGLSDVTCGSGCHPYLQQPAIDGLRKAITTRSGSKLTCNSAYRTVAQQFVLYNHFCCRRCGITAAALPGNSNHNSGLALDIEDYSGWLPYLENCGYDWLGSWDKWHFDFVGDHVSRPKLRDIRKISILAFQQLWNLNRDSAAIKIQLKEDGVWSDQTKQALLHTPVEGFQRSAITSGKSVIKPSAITTSRPPQRKGSKGEFVKELQKLLKITPDGDFGVNTEKAVRAYQAANGLVADGVVGLATWERLLG